MSMTAIMSRKPKTEQMTTAMNSFVVSVPTSNRCREVV